MNIWEVEVPGERGVDYIYLLYWFGIESTDLFSFLGDSLNENIFKYYHGQF